MTPAEVMASANSLLEAEYNGRQISLLSLAHPGMKLDDAYRIQAELTKLKLDAGRHIIGWKIGLTSRAMQQALGIETPDSGVLFDNMLFPNSSIILKDYFIQPRVEAEIAFVMKAPLYGKVTREEVLDATESVVPSIEILDTRIVRHDPESGRLRTVVDTISDNAANAGFILGHEHHPPRAHDLRRVGAIVYKNGKVEETGLGAGVLDDPVTGIIWLAERLAEYGNSIEEGQIILSGSFIRPIECPKGTRIHADFGDFGSVNCKFD